VGGFTPRIHRRSHLLDKNFYTNGAERNGENSEKQGEKAKSLIFGGESIVAYGINHLDRDSERFLIQTVSRYWPSGSANVLPVPPFRSCQCDS